MNKSTFLPFKSTAATLIWAAYAASLPLYAVSTQSRLEGSAALAILGSVLMVCTTFIVVKVGDEPMSGKVFISVLAGCLATVALVSTQLPTEVAYGRAAWHLGAYAWVFVIVAFRGRILWAALGFSAVYGSHFAWELSVGKSLVGGIVGNLFQFAVLTIGILAARLVRRTESSIRELHAHEATSQAHAAALEAAEEVRLERAMSLQREAVPLLKEISSAQELSPELQNRALILEAEIRDSIRAKGLQNPALVTAVKNARRRSIAVTLFDDRDKEVSADVAESLWPTVAKIVDESPDGSLTIRLLPEQDERQLTILSRSTKGTIHHSFGNNGEHQVVTLAA